MRDAVLAGVNQIFCSYDNPKGNAETERVIRTVKEELLWLNEFTSFEEARERIGNWIDSDYNRLYVHSAIGYRSPVEFREAWEESEGLRAQLGVC
jgi:transposase InsO family protein